MMRPLLGLVACVMFTNRPCASPPAVQPIAQPWQATVNVILDTTRHGSSTRRVATYRLMIAADLFRLDLGSVCVLGRREDASASLIAWHTRDPQSAFIARGPDLAGLLRQQLPPLWSSPLAQFLSQHEDASPLVGHTWSHPPAVLEIDAHNRSLITNHLTVERQFDGESSRLVRETIRSSEPQAEFTLELTYEWSPASSSAAWGIEIANRTLVPSVSALAPRTPTIEVGRSVASLRLIDAIGNVWTVGSAFRPEPTASLPRSADLFVLVLHAVSTREGSTLPLVPLDRLVACIDQLRQEHALESALHAQPRQRALVRIAAVFDVPDYAPARLEEIAKIAERVAADPLLPGLEASVPRMLITHPPRETIDLIAPGASTVVVVVDATTRLVAAIPIEAGTDSWQHALSRVLNPTSLDHKLPESD